MWEDTIKLMGKKNEQEKDNKRTKQKRTAKQIAALICVVLLIAMYIFTLVVALLDFPGADRLFAACLLMTIGLPILLWIFIWIYGRIRRDP